MSIMSVGADADFRAAPVRKHGFFEILGASIRVARAIEANHLPVRHDLEILGIDGSFDDKPREPYCERS